LISKKSRNFEFQMHNPVQAGLQEGHTKCTGKEKEEHGHEAEGEHKP